MRSVLLHCILFVSAIETALSYKACSPVEAGFCIVEAAESSRVYGGACNIDAGTATVCCAGHTALVANFNGVVDALKGESTFMGYCNPLYQSQGCMCIKATGCSVDPM